MEYGYKGHELCSKFRYLYKHKKDFNAVNANLAQYTDKRVPTPSMKFASVGQNRPAKWQKTSTTHGAFKGKVEFKKYSREEHDSMSTAQCHPLYEL